MNKHSIEIRRRVGFLPGDLAMYPKLSGRVVLDYLARLRGGVDPRVRDSLAERLDADLERPIRHRVPILAHPFGGGARHHRLAILRHGRLVIVDSLQNLRKVAIQRLEIEFAAPVDANEFRTLPGVTEVGVDGQTVTVGFEGSADAVVKTAAAHEVLAVRPREDDLEDIFLRYYQAEPTK